MFLLLNSWSRSNHPNLSPITTNRPSYRDAITLNLLTRAKRLLKNKKICQSNILIMTHFGKCCLVTRAYLKHKHLSKIQIQPRDRTKVFSHTKSSNKDPIIPVILAFFNVYVCARNQFCNQTTKSSANKTKFSHFLQHFI